MIPRVKSEVIVHDEIADTVVIVIQRIAHAVYRRREELRDPGREKVRIRTDERGRETI